MSASQRTKGAEGEREVIRLLHKYGWENAERTSNGRNQEGRGDVANGPANAHIEIKRQERLSVPAAFDQIRRDAGALEMPVLIHRPSRHVWMATTELNRFLPMLSLWEFR